MGIKLCLHKDRLRHFASYGSCLRASQHLYKNKVKGQIQLLMSLVAKRGGSLLTIDNINFIVQNVKLSLVLGKISP